MYKLILPRSWSSQFLSQIGTLVKRGDNINIWGLPSIGKSIQLKRTKKLPNKNLLCIHIDTQVLTSITPEDFYKLLAHHLKEFDKTFKAEFDSCTMVFEIQQAIKKITKNKKLCIVIDTLEHLKSMDESFFTSLKYLRDENLGSLNFVFISDRPLYEHPVFGQYKQFVDFACDNEIIAPAFSVSEILEVLDPIEEEFGVELSEEHQDTIMTLSGGILGLLKGITRVIERDPEYEPDIDTYLREPSIKTGLARIYESFTDDEKKFLKASMNGDHTPKVNTNYLLHSGILDEDKNIKSALLKKYILNQTNPDSDKKVTSSSDDLSFDYNTGEIYKKGIRQPSLLSNTEIKIIKYMISKKDKIATREDLAKIIWGKDFANEYSDWAIAKAVSRIRRKITDKRPYEHFLTIKNKGFKFNINKKS